MESRMEVSRVRRKDTTKGPPLRILSLDGGGVRGYSMLILLQELMHRTFVEIEGRAPKRHEIPKPCDHFDLIAGTGTGGLIAIMLGRLRLDLDTCKDVYVRMTKRVFETDKTFAGIPYRSTLFKASKLEEAIRECVREHTIHEEEGNDHAMASVGDLRAPLSPGPQRSISNASRYSQIGMSPVAARSSLAFSRWGNPNALLYDDREERTKTAVTAVYKGTPKNGNSVLLRSYDSRKEPAPEFDCTIWQAGRATCATALAFKPIQIGQSVFLDEGAGKYNPAPQILDEAVCNEWPGREVGVFVSLGTGKRPPGTHHQQHEWWEGFVSSEFGSFAEARRKLISKIEGCEDTHQYMLHEHLGRRHVNPENYYRLNVEVGVGDFGMNEWSRLADISTSTRRYLAKNDVQNMNLSAAAKLSKIHRAKLRWERTLNGHPLPGDKPLPEIQKPYSPPPPSNPLAVELPAEEVHPVFRERPYITDSLLNPDSAAAKQYPPQVVSSDEYPQPVDSDPDAQAAHDRFSGDFSNTYRISNSSIVPSPPPRRSGESFDHPFRPPSQGDGVIAMPASPPPVPPKTPIPYPLEPGEEMTTSSPVGSPRLAPVLNRSPPLGGISLPYPDTDGPPPMVNVARKPEFIGR